VKRGKVIGIFICVLVLGVTGLYFVNRDKEPTYDGRTLSEWADLARNGDSEASKAIRHMGTNTLPLVLAHREIPGMPKDERNPNDPMTNWEIISGFVALDCVGG